MAKIVAVANQKGGVGKTTTCVSLTAALAGLGKKVLLADFDPQGNSTSGMGVSKRSLPSAHDVVMGYAPARDAVIRLPYGWLLPANTDLSGAEVELAALPDREFKLREALEDIRDDFDYIFIDCPPSLGLLTLNAFHRGGHPAGAPPMRVLRHGGAGGPHHLGEAGQQTAE